MNNKLQPAQKAALESLEQPRFLPHPIPQQVFRDLEAQGFVKREWVVGGNTWRITPAGKQALRTTNESSHRRRHAAPR